MEAKLWQHYDPKKSYWVLLSRIFYYTLSLCLPTKQLFCSFLSSFCIRATVSLRQPIFLLYKNIMCESQEGQATEGKSTAASRVHDNNDGEEESAGLQLDGEVPLGKLIWVKLHENSWWPALVIDENSVSGSCKPGNRSQGEVLVRLYGSHELLYADPTKYSSEFKMILEQNNGSCFEILNKALEQDFSRKKSIKPKGKGSKSTANRRADASKGKKKSNQKQAKGNQMDVNAGKALVKNARETNSKVSKQNGVKRKLGSNETSSEKVLKGKNSNQDRQVKKSKSNSPRAEENASGKNPRQDGSNFGDKARSRASKQDEIQKKLKRKSPSTTSPQKKGKTSKQGEEQKKVKSNSPSSDGVKSRTPKQNKLLKEKSNSQSSERTSTGKSLKSSARRTRVMQGLGLVAPPGSPFHKN